MLMQPTIEKLIAMKLAGMAEALRRQSEDSEMGRLSFEERIALLVDQQWTWRENKALTRRLKNARLKLDAAIEDIDYRHPRRLDRPLLRSLSACGWVTQHQNILILGPTGIGKSFLACALTQKAVRDGFTALYTRAPRLLRDLAVARVDGSLAKLLDRIARIDVLIVDDWAMAPLADTERRDFLEICDDRYATRSTILTSQIPLTHWHDQIGDPTVADSILDRLVHNAHRIELQGASMRKTKTVKSSDTGSEPPAGGKKPAA
jgi:DNA replication protein DnaC